MKFNNLLALILVCTSVLTVAQSNHILLKSGNYTPENNIDAVLKNNTIQNSEIVNGNYYRMVQFSTIPTNNQKRVLESAGITLLNYIPNNAFYASIKVGSDLTVLKQNGAISIVDITNSHKLTNVLLTGNYPEWTLYGTSKIELNALFYDNISNDNIITALKNKGIELLKINQHQTVRLRVELDRLKEVYQMSQFYYFEQLDEPEQPENLVGRTNHRSNTIATSYNNGLNYNGTGITVMLQDDGIIGPHIDYEGRVDMRTTSNSGDHGDHVAGIIMGAGNLDPTTKGMAFGADVLVYSASNNYYDSVPYIYANNNVTITSKSYGDGCNSGYSTLTRELDQQVRTMPSLIHVFSCGNSGSSNCGYGAGAGWGNITGGHKTGKNVLAIGNLSYIDALAGSSSRGPADDGRIKPDICAVGSSVYSTVDVNSYSTKSGTSMACPGVSGSLAQLYEAYKDLNGGVNPNSGLIKAMILNTADDLGNAGPDYKYGWGRINVGKAYNLMSNNNYLSGTISQGGNNTHNITVPAGTSQLRVMVYWTDYEAAASTNRAIVNNINFSVTDPTAASFNPWVLDPTANATNLNAVAVRALDSLNNMEQVTIDSPVAGSYTLNVDGFSIPQGAQDYYIVYEFLTDDVQLTYPLGGEGFDPGTTETIRWDAYGNSGFFKLEYSTDNGGSWSNIFAFVSSVSRYYTWTVPNTVSGQVLVRITRGTSVDVSDEVFSIIDVPDNLAVNWACPDSLELTWDPVSGATGYEVSKLGSKYMDSIAVSVNNTAVVYGPSAGWFSVKALGPNNAIGRRAIAINNSSNNFNCPVPCVATNIPVTEGFENGTITPVNWDLQNPDGDDTWQHTTDAGGFGTSTSSALIDNFTSDFRGKKDYIITEAYDFTNVTASDLTFDVAYAEYSATYSDTMAVYYSIDCGVSKIMLWEKEGTTLSTTGATVTSSFTPTSNQWRTETVDLSALAGLPSVNIMFESRSGWGNRLFFDNVNLIDNSATGIRVNEVESIRLYPNPVKDELIIDGVSKITAIEIYNSIGKRVYQKSFSSETEIKLNLNFLEAGIYMLNISTENNSLFEKIIKE